MEVQRKRIGKGDSITMKYDGVKLTPDEAAVVLKVIETIKRNHFFDWDLSLKERDIIRGLIVGLAGKFLNQNTGV